MKKENKPPFSISSMDEIRKVKWNGFKVASTFSGCGGSCLGYRMAGFKVVWANEFVPAAQESYRANADPCCFLDLRDIKMVKPEEILEQTGLKVGELDLFDGSPPCQAFSTAGKREKGWGKNKTYEHGAQQKNETLFDEYIRLLRGLKPKVFVAENVSGLVKGTAKGFFFQILADLKASGYRVACRVCDAQWLGVPQRRQRTIFIGVREDLGLNPIYPMPFKFRYYLGDIFPEWHKQKGKIIWPNKGFKGGDEFGVDLICPTVCAACTNIGGTSGSLFVSNVEKRKFTIAEVKRICSFPDDFILKGSYARQWERCGNSVPPLMMKAIAETIRDGILKKL